MAGPERGAIAEPDTQPGVALADRQDRRERWIKVIANALVFLPLVTMSFLTMAILTNRYSEPTDAPDAGQGEGVLVGFGLMLLIAGGIVVCAKLHTSPGTLVLRHAPSGKRLVLGGLVLANAAVAIGAFSAYEIVAIDHPSPPDAIAAELRRGIAETAFDAAALPDGVDALDASGPGPSDPTPTAGSPRLTVVTQDRQRTGTITYYVRASASDARTVSEKWSSDESFGWHAFDYPSLCSRRNHGAEHACFVRVGQTLIDVRVRGTSANDKADEELAIDITRAAIEHLESVIDSMHAGDLAPS